MQPLISKQQLFGGAPPPAKPSPHTTKKKKKKREKSWSSTASQDLPREDALPEVVLPLHEVQEQAPPDAKSAIEKVAAIMTDSPHKLVNQIDRTAQEAGISRRHLVRLACSLSEISLQHQRASLTKTLEYIQLMSNTKHLRPLLFVSHWRYEETPLRLKAQYSLGNAYVHVTKTFVLQCRWRALLEPADRQEAFSRESCFLIEGSFSPFMRVCENSSAETITEICPLPKQVLQGLFPTVWRLVDSDQNPANAKAEKIWREDGHETGVLQSFCMAHKGHLVAMRVWDLHSDLHTGVLKSLRVLQQPGNMKKFECALVELVVEKLDFAPATTCDADSYREHTLRLFAPDRSERPHAWAIAQLVSRLLLNGDWRLSDPVQHVCKHTSGSPCCQDRAHLIAKVKRWIPKMLRALRLKLVNKANWSDWPSSLFLVGLLCRLHSLFTQAFDKAFRKLPKEVAAEEGERTEEVQDSGYEDVTQMAKTALQWWNTAGAKEALFIFRAALWPQHRLMRSLLHNSGAAFEVSNLCSRLQGRQFRTQKKTSRAPPSRVRTLFGVKGKGPSRLSNVVSLRFLNATDVSRGRLGGLSPRRHGPPNLPTINE